jgi:hypothetical protein
MIFRLFQHPDLLARIDDRRAARENRSGTGKLGRVLEATLKGPQRGSHHPTNPRPQPTKEQRRLRATTQRFSARNGPRDSAIKD